MVGKLYLVATPIGNLQDISHRAIAILQQVAAIACEDTRVSRHLLDALGIDKPLFALHQHNEHGAAQAPLSRLQAGEDIAVISDAGTPVISDPGAWISRLAHENGITVVPIPGANAVITALCASGLTGDCFHFAGFIPAKNGERLQFLSRFQTARETTIFYESPHRIEDSLIAMQSLFSPARRLVIARELTKTFEQIVSLRIDNALEWFNSDSNHRRGEFVLLLAAEENPTNNQAWHSFAEELLNEGLSLKIISRLMQNHCGANKKEVYNYLLTKKDDINAANR